VGTSAAASDAAKLMAVVVLPTPPFWLATAITRPMSSAENRLANSEYARRRAGLNLNLLCKRKNPVKMFHVEHFGSEL
jgi:hypothetical protein